MALPAADFTFGTMLRAGLANGDWEMTTGIAPGDTTQPKADAFPSGFAQSYYSDGGWQYFEIGYNGTSGFIRLYDTATLISSSRFITTSYASAAPPAANATWTLNTYLSAASGNPAKPYSEVTLNALALGTGLSVIAPLSGTSFNANATGNGPAGRADIGPVIFQSNNAQGAWVLSGQVRFLGLLAYTPNGASRAQLQFGLTASASEVPEPGTWALCLTALLATCIRYSWRRPPRARAAE